ncbi:MFS transporter [Streptococcus equinus]|uniref:MFS transporter n=1 Tax=Streptococcus equinus TaxID=1335 RepID=UPI0008EBD2CE|nr:MFS transporter [Streptococcus equinus]SFF83628.1 Major Facilitator Superfamily protein [Streptococcus equinus]
MTRKQIGLATIGLLLANFMGGLDTTLLNVALSQIVSDMHAVNEVGLLTSILLFTIAVTTVLWGKFAEKIGNKKAFVIATVIFVVASTIGGLASSIWLLIIARAFMGIGIGGMVSIPFIIYIDLYPKLTDRATALGWVTAFYAVATILGPIIGGVLVDNLGWRSVFFINVPFGILSIILLRQNYKEKMSSQQKSKVDIAGITLLILALSLLLYTITSISSLSLPIIIGLLILIGILTITFWKVEKSATDPILPPVLFTNWPYIAKSLLMTLVYGLTMAYSIYAPMWAQNILHTNATLAGGTQILSSILLILATRFTPGLFKRFNFKTIIQIGFLFVLLSAVIMSILPSSSPYWLLVFTGGLQGLGQGMIFPPAQVAFQEDVDSSIVGVATTFSLLIRTLGQTLVTSIYGVIYAQSVASGVDKSQGRVSLSDMNNLGTLNPSSVSTSLLHEMEKISHNGFHIIFIIALILVFIGAVVNQFSWQKNK